jgi:hypothetical protein
VLPRCAEGLDTDTVPQVGASDRHEDDDFPPQRPFGERGSLPAPERREDDDRTLPAVPSRGARAQAPVTRS